MVEPEINPTRKKKLKHSFFLGNGIKEVDPIEAAKKLLFRDHKDVAELNVNYYNGKLGPKFLPPMFYSAIPNVVNPSAYRGVHIILDFRIVQPNAPNQLRAKQTQLDPDVNPENPN